MSLKAGGKSGQRWLNAARESSEELADDTSDYLDRAADGHADLDDFLRLERSAIETLITIRDAAHTLGAIDDNDSRLEASEKLLQAVHAVDGDRNELAIERMDIDHSELVGE